MQNKKYGEYGGQYVAESLMSVLAELETAYNEAINDPKFIEEYNYYLKEYVGRETPLYFAEKLSKKYGTKIYLKREDLNHTGAHKINNVIGQILLAKRMGKKKVIAETGAGQHGVATATGAALFDMECTVFMGEEDMERQALNVFRMEMLGTKVECVKSGSRTLKDATNEAIRTWAKNAEDTFYIIGSAVGPHPYPQMVKEFQKVISVETKKQILEKRRKTSRLRTCLRRRRFQLHRNVRRIHLMRKRRRNLIWCRSSGIRNRDRENMPVRLPQEKQVYCHANALLPASERGWRYLRLQASSPLGFDSRRIRPRNMLTCTIVEEQPTFLSQTTRQCRH